VTVRSWAFPIDQTTDAGFRALGADISAKFAEVGLVKASDTGQIDWTTTLRPTSGGYAGYEIWRYPDSSIFIKIEYGSASGFSNLPAWRVAISNSTNGAGTLTGTVSDVMTITSAGSANGTVRTSYLSFSNGCLGLVWGVTNESSYMFFAVTRPVDSNGSPLNIGAILYGRTNASTPFATRAQALNFSTATTFTQMTNADFCMVPGGITSSLVGGFSQAFVHWMAIPKVYPVISPVTVVSSEIGQGITFQTTMVGTTPRTYIALGNETVGRSAMAGVAAATTYKLAMLWE
jgi:hypothetical protein